MSDTPRTDALWVDPNKIGVNGTISALDALARSLERELAAEKARGDRLEKALREALSEMVKHDDADFQCESVAGAVAAKSCRSILEAALGDTNG